MGNSRLYKRISSKATPKRVAKVIAMHAHRTAKQRQRNLARQAMQQAQKDLIQRRLASRRFGLARPVGPGYKD